MFLKSKKFWIILVIVLIIGGLVVMSLIGKEAAPKYETVKVVKGDLLQTVDVTGRIKSQNNVSLNFETSGIIDKIYIKEGEAVKKNDVLAKLNLDNLNSLVEQARANLNQKIAGVSDEQINVSQRQTDASEVALKKAEANLESVKDLANENSKNKYESALNLLNDFYVKLFTIQKDARALKNLYFSQSNQEGINIANQIEYNIEAPIVEMKTYLDNAKSSEMPEDIDLAISKMDSTLKSTIGALLFIKNICESVNYESVISLADMTTLDQNKLTVSTSQIALTNAQNEISLLKLQNESNINTAKLAKEEALANLELQKANYESLIANPRETDLAYLRSVLSQAIANRNKAIITSPIDGIVVKINKEKGELISSAEALVEALSPKYQIEVNVPETDVVKISIGDRADIELDAIENNILNAEVITIDPAATTIQDVVYYKVVLSIVDDDQRIKPGMTADVLVYTDEKNDVLYLPSRSILSEGDKKYVRVLKDGEIIEKDVVIGLYGDDSKRQILSGINEGDEIVLKTLD